MGGFRRRDPDQRGRAIHRLRLHPAAVHELCPHCAAFLEDIGGGSFNAGAKNFGTRSSSSPTGCFDNILVLGAYVPTYWEDQQKIVYESVDDYYEADQYHYDGYTEVIFTGENADVLALYREELGEPLSEEAETWLHTDHFAWQMPGGPGSEQAL